MLRGTWLAGLQNATQRFDACQSTPLPAASQQYLDTSFLGQRQSLEVESVNYTFFRFGPLQAGLSGVRMRQEELRSAIYVQPQPRHLYIATLQERCKHADEFTG